MVNIRNFYSDPVLFQPYLLSLSVNFSGLLHYLFREGAWKTRGFPELEDELNGVIFEKVTLAAPLIGAWLLQCTVWLTCKESPPKSHMLESRWPTAGSGWLEQQLGQAGIPVLVLQTPPHTHCCIPSGWCIQRVSAMVPRAKPLPQNYPMDQEKEIS